MGQDLQAAEHVSKRATLGGWVSVGANAAVLGGLIFVAVQIGQNTSVIRGAAYQTWVAANMELNAAVTDGLGEVLARGHADPTTLTEETWIEYTMWVFSLMQMVQATDYLYREGSIDEELWEVEIQRAAIHLTSPGVRQWWDAGGRTQLAPRFAELVESTPLTITGVGWDPEIGFRPGFADPTAEPGRE